MSDSDEREASEEEEVSLLLNKRQFMKFRLLVNYVRNIIHVIVDLVFRKKITNPTILHQHDDERSSGEVPLETLFWKKQR